MMADKYIILKRLNEDYKYVESLGYKVFGVFLQGSQNYQLDYVGSDIDTKCIVLPTFEDFVLNKKPVSTTLIREDNSHIDVKDIRLMWECFLKQNINFLEILFTEYYCCNSEYISLWYEMTAIRERIAHYNNYSAVNCIVGMIYEKHKALCHPYPSVKDKIEKYGYDNKQLHHIMRFIEFLQRYINGESYENCLISPNRDLLIKVKSQYIFELDEARTIAHTYDCDAKELRDSYMRSNELKIDKEVKNMMNKILVEVLKQSFSDDINN